MTTTPASTTPTTSAPTTGATIAGARRRSPRFAMGAVALTMVAGLAACGGDDAKSSSASGQATGAGAAAGTSASARNAPAAVCDGSIQLTAVMGEAPRDPGAIKEFAQTKVLPVAKGLAAALPADVAGAGTDLVAGYQSIVDTGDPSGLESPKMAAAQKEIGTFVHERCPVNAIDVAALDYSFAGISDTITAGRTSFKLENKGSEDHEIVVLRRNDGVSENFEALSKLPQEQMFSKVAFTGVAFGKPGSTSFAAIDLKPGTYFLVCSLPVGGKEGGAPHFTHGMQRTITVAAPSA